MAKPVDFGEWIPDQILTNDRRLINAKNVVPAASGYRPLRAYSASTSAVASQRVRGAQTFRRGNGSVVTIAGTRAYLKKLNVGTLSWDDISDATYGTDEENGFWSMTQYNNLAIMTNYDDNVKKYDISTTPATVSDLGGSPPKARHIMTVKDFVVLGGIYDYPNRVQWCDIFAPETWSSGLADYQDFPHGGRVMSVMGGEIGYVFQERAIRAMQFTPGASSAFQIDPVEQDRGSAAYRGLVQVGATAFYLAHDGFFFFDNGRSTPIGQERIDAWFYSNVQGTVTSRTVAGIDPKKKLIFWAFISTENSDAVGDAKCDKILIFHWPTKRWAWASVRVSCFLDLALTGTSLELVGDIDAMTSLSLDDPSINADTISSTLALFDADYKMGYFTGSNMEALFEIERLELFPPMRQYVRGAWPIADADQVSMAIAPRESIGGSETFGDYVSQESGSGFVPLDSSGRFHDIRVKIASGDSWTLARGIYVDASEDGEL